MGMKQYIKIQLWRYLFIENLCEKLKPSLLA